MAYQLRITTTYIGQGLGNTIEVLNMNGPNPVGEYLAIYDFGCTNGNSDPAINYVTDCINRRNPNVAGNHIDALYVSHLDADHHNCLHALPVNAGHALNVINLIFGGSPNPGPAAGNIPVAIGNYVPGNVHFTYNTYVHPHNNPYLLPAAGQGLSFNYVFMNGGHQYRLRLNTLCYRSDMFNFVHPAWPANILINMGSTILLASIIDATSNNAIASALFTGDATVGTLVHFLNCGYPPPAVPYPQRRFNFVNEYKYMTVPHHGAERTIRDYLAVNAAHPVTFNGLENFLDNFFPDAATASAQNPNWIWGHPRQSVMNVYDNIMPPSMKPDHSNLYYDNIGNQVNLNNVDKELYTTVFNNQANVLAGRGVVIRVDINDNNNFDIEEEILL